MQRLGFIHDMLDVKVLILFVAARANYPMTVQEIYETCYVDDCLSYFDVCTAIPEMVTSGHLKEVEEQKYVITDKGRELLTRAVPVWTKTHHEIETALGTLEVDVGQDDPDSPGGQVLADRLADAGATPGDHGHLPVERHDDLLVLHWGRSGHSRC